MRENQTFTEIISILLVAFSIILLLGFLGIGAAWIWNSFAEIVGLSIFMTWWQALAVLAFIFVFFKN